MQLARSDSPYLLANQPTTTDMNIGETIRNIRKKRGIRQAELASEINITQSYLSQIENNKKEPHLSTLANIANILDIPLPALFFLAMEDEDVGDDRKVAFSELSPRVKELISDICDVSHSQ